LNFNEESKGNPGPAETGGVFRNDTSGTILIFTSYLGKTTNNATELQALIQGLLLASQHDFNLLLVEGDSLLMIQALKKIQCGTNPKTMSRNWHLTTKFTKLSMLLNFIPVIIPSHVRRKANKLPN
jgi:ribonuclease HI